MSGNDGVDRRHRHNQRPDYRGPFERDRDRVLYSSAFRRLAGVTQVAAVSEQRVLHNRLTHSLKVAQLGRRIAQCVASGQRDLAEQIGVNPDVVETAGLAHDLGHPPFGHIAEEVLNDRVEAIPGLEGFEGNAQTFRIVTKLAIRRDSHAGLDLTRSSLNAILKYPGTFADRKKGCPEHWTDRTRGDKWGAYASERDDFAWARQGSERHVRCPNAVIMDWADDITYATHDIEDYFRAGMIPLHDLGRDRDELIEQGKNRRANKRGFDEQLFEQAMVKVLELLNGQGRSPNWETKQNRAWLNEVTTTHLTQLVDAVYLDDDSGVVRIHEEAQYAVEALKELTWFYVIDRPGLAMMQEGQRRIIGKLFDQLVACLKKNPRSRRVPVMLRQLYEDVEPEIHADAQARCARAVVDYLCLLTEGQAIDLRERMNGTTRNSMFGAWFH
ncbi:dNTP triphosphohydrolase [Lentzea sp. BCCO 10_0856]|uniref:DNTP triphosphohydrolase n=1 Tax=Lentzea miocenica TaxID=3095431 RepID=A0ABU4T7G2_9PSEU|nr:dNTP triphosphohydrolase [Lentzea sp. BCCO 10_0856]MDX8034093.1 dNTP triphosphohydrolase [Lentzea sp. BCCO 10_0856]